MIRHPVKTDNPSPYSQSFNSLGQGPCEVASYLQGICDDGGTCATVLDPDLLALFLRGTHSGCGGRIVFTIPALLPGDSYVGPTGPTDASDLCKCNTVVYSLMSACDACQDALWFSYVLLSAYILCLLILEIVLVVIMDADGS